MNYLIDIDGTITDDVPNEEPQRMKTCIPFPGSTHQINRWYDEGHTITFFTSRTEEHRKITEEWLYHWGFRYHNLLLGKPRGGNYIWIENLPAEVIKYPEKHSWVPDAGWSGSCTTGTAADEWEDRLRAIHDN